MRECVCVVDGKTNMLESNQKEFGQQIITVNDKLENFVSKVGDKVESIESEMQCLTNTIHVIDNRSSELESQIAIVKNVRNEVESNCKTEIQAIQNTVNTIDKNNKQFEYLNNNKFVSIEQSIVNAVSYTHLQF